MEIAAKNYLPGLLSGILVSHVSVYSIAACAAIAMPRGFPVALWEVSVVFGLGAFMPALVIYLFTLLVARPDHLASLTGFCVAVIASFCFFTGLTLAGSALASLVLGSLASTTLAGLWSKRSFKTDGLAAA